MLQTQALRISYLVDDLLTLAKIDDAGLTYTPQGVDLDGLALIHRLVWADGPDLGFGGFAG